MPRASTLNPWHEVHSIIIVDKVRRERRWTSAGVKLPPGNWFAPPVVNRETKQFSACSTVLPLLTSSNRKPFRLERCLALYAGKDGTVVGAFLSSLPREGPAIWQASGNAGMLLTWCARAFRLPVTAINFLAT
jgi:hypothetical protein